VLTLFLTVFVDTVGFGIVLPLLPYFAQRYGAAADIVTLLVAVFTASQFAFGPVWGRLSDRFGRRPILLVTLFGTMLGYALLAFSDSLPMIFAARAVTGAMGANVAVVQAYVADVTGAQHRARGMGRIGAANGLGFVTGPAIGGLFAGGDPDHPIFTVPFLIASGLSGIAFAMALVTVRESLADEHRVRRDARRRGRIAAFRAAIKRPQLGHLFALLTMTPFVFTAIESTFVLWSERTLGWGPAQNGWVYTFMGMVAVVVQGLAVGRLTRRIGERRALLVGAGLVGAGAALLPFMAGYAGLCLAFGLVVSGVCINNPCLSSLISQHAGTGERGTLLGVAQSCSALARISGPLWGGFAFVTLGPDWPFLSTTVVMAAMALLALRLPPARPLILDADRSSG
jgi:DHA1 family tetracycline resistance protein-like MFS transporter